MDQMSVLFQIYPNLTVNQVSFGSGTSCYKVGFVGLPWFTPQLSDVPEVQKFEVSSFAAHVRKSLSSGFSCDFDILIIQRLGSRKIIQLDSILSAGKAAGYQIKTAIFERIEFSQQIRLVSCSKILICAHGAATTHVIFMRESSIIVELYPHEVRSISYPIHGNLNFRGKLIEGLNIHNPDVETNIYGHLSKIVGVAHLRIFGGSESLDIKEARAQLDHDFRNYDIDKLDITSLFSAVEVTLRLIRLNCTRSIVISELIKFSADAAPCKHIVS